MLEMKQTTKFKKDLKRLKKRNVNFEKQNADMQMIVEEALLPEEKYRAHILEPTKDYIDCREYHISGRNSDWLLIYKFCRLNILFLLSELGHIHMYFDRQKSFISF